jgi:hypothetical protein
MFIPPISPQSPSPIIRGWYMRPVVAAVPKVPPHKLKKKEPPYTRLYDSVKSILTYTILVGFEDFMETAVKSNVSYFVTP